MVRAVLVVGALAAALVSAPAYAADEDDLAPAVMKGAARLRTESRADAPENGYVSDGMPVFARREPENGFRWIRTGRGITGFVPEALVALSADAGGRPQSGGPVLASYLRAARRIEFRNTPEAVEAATRELGEPGVVSYSWCNQAGCIDDVSEVRATRMLVMWSGADADVRSTLGVVFCGGTGEWIVAAIFVRERPEAKGAFGTSAKPVDRLERVDRNLLRSRCSK